MSSAVLASILFVVVRGVEDVGNCGGDACANAGVEETSLLQSFRGGHADDSMQPAPEVQQESDEYQPTYFPFGAHQDPEPEAEFAEEPCLCAFDIDRTLTGKQGWADRCPHNRQVDGVPDTAFHGGTLVLSELALRLNETFCHLCYKGIVSVGWASGPDSPERQVLVEVLGGTKYTRSAWWQPINHDPTAEIRSSLVTNATDGIKQKFVKTMLQWWESDQNITIKPENVYFFDDRADNVQGFEGSGFNARQISCASRGPSERPGMFDGQVGACGGAFSEVVQEKGVVFCS